MILTRREFLRGLASGGIVLFGGLDGLEPKEDHDLEKIVTNFIIREDGSIIEERKLYNSIGKEIVLPLETNKESKEEEFDLDYYNYVKRRLKSSTNVQKYDVFLYDLDFKNKRFIAKDFTGEFTNIDNSRETFAYLLSNDLNNWSLCYLNGLCQNFNINEVFGPGIEDVSSYNFSGGELPDYLIASYGDGLFYKYYINRNTNDPIKIDDISDRLNAEFFSKFVGSVKYPKQLFALEDKLMLNDGASWYTLSLNEERKKGVQLHDNFFLNSIGNIPAKIKPIKTNGESKLAVFIVNNGINGRIVSALGPNDLESPIADALVSLYISGIKRSETLTNSKGEYGFDNEIGDTIEMLHPEYYPKAIRIDDNRMVNIKEFGFPRINSYMIPKNFPIELFNALILITPLGFRKYQKSTLKFLNPKIPIYLDFDNSNKGLFLTNLWNEFIINEFPKKIGNFIIPYISNSNIENKIVIKTESEVEGGWNIFTYFSKLGEITRGEILISPSYNFSKKELSLLKWRGLLSALTSFGRTNNFRSIFASLNSPNNLAYEPTQDDRNAVFINYKLQAGTPIEWK